MIKKEEKILPLQYIKGIGPKRAEVLAAAGLNTPVDLLYYIPRAYVSHEKVATLAALSIKLRKEAQIFENDFNTKFTFRNEITIVARVINHHEHTFGRSKKLLKLVLGDNSGGTANIIFWSYADFYKKKYPVGQLITVTGKAELDDFGKINFTHPDIEIFTSEDENEYKSGSILPIYKLTEKMRSAGFNTRQIRTAVSTIIDNELNNIHEVLPEFLLSKYEFPDIHLSLRNLHFPENEGAVDIAEHRMKFHEIFFFELYLAIRKTGFKITEKGITINPKSSRARLLVEALSFELTGDQKKVIREIMDDMKTGTPMNRLLQGDVGSGKTIVAVLTMLAVIDNGYQVVFLAPTEILAEQHFHTLKKFTENLEIVVTQLIGGQRTKLRREVLEEIASGKSNIIVGTHALFESEVKYNKLGFVIIDEQHRFGVAQRADLKRLASDSLSNDISPHMLVMSATPIPRTLSLTLYGDLDVSIIREMPKNRLPIRTRVSFESLLPDIYNFVREKVKAGQQAYIVYPLVEKSEKLELKAATEHFELLSTEVFPEFKCGLLHGQMFWYEKEEAMNSFLNKEYQILVTTTVIEVGIDIPNATIMLIENAERFGLSQLHQLRGRVGRGSVQSFCILVTKDKFKFEIRKKENEDEQKAAIIRLKTMEKTCDGFEIAEVDMKLRGPGDVMGTKQSGLPDFKFLDLATDHEIIASARKEAFDLVSQDPELVDTQNSSLKKEIIRLYKDENFFDIA